MGAKGKTYFDEGAADRICKWFEEIIIAPEIGHTVPLQPWLREVLRKAYGTKNPDGTRTIRTLYLFLPKKNSKSFILSALSLFHLCADNELSGEVYAVAADKSQASIVFEASKAMRGANSKLAKQVRPYRYSLIHEKSGSKYHVLSADAYTKEGIKASCILFDELHVQPDRRLWDTLRGSGLSRQQPMTIVATTAGDSKTGIAWEVHDYACRVRDGKIADPSFLPVIFAAPDDAKIDDVAVWKAANPSFGVTFQEQDYRSLYMEAKAAGPARLASWKRYHLNIWQESVTAWLPMDKWNGPCAARVIVPTTLENKVSHCGVDLSSTTDLTACSLLFPTDDGGYELLAYHWMPRGRVIEAEQRDKVQYRQWAAQGYLELTEGNAIDQRLILKRVMALNDKYPFHQRQVRLDDYNAVQFIQDLEANGFTPVPVSPKARGISAPSKELLRLVIEGKLYHGGNPLLTWQAAQCDVVEDSENNIRPVKGKGEARKRIDGILAMVYSLSGATVNRNAEAKAQPSVYESRGLFVL